MLESLTQSKRETQIAYNRMELYKDIFMHDINNILQNINSSMELLKSFNKSQIKDLKTIQLYEIIEEQVKRGVKWEFH